MPNWPYKRTNSSSFGFSYSLTAIIPASAALIQPLLLLLNAKLTLQKNQFLLLRLLLLSHGHYSRFCCSLTVSAAPLKCKLTLQKNQFLLLRLLLLSHDHYSRFCCSLTASAAPPKWHFALKKTWFLLYCFCYLLRPLNAHPCCSTYSIPALLVICCFNSYFYFWVRGWGWGEG